jgi:hypothetical protein
MCEKLVAAAALLLLFMPMLFSEMTQLGEDRDMMGNKAMRAGSQLGNSQRKSGGDHGKKQVAAAPARTDNVNDILSFEARLNLTSQQVILIKMIASDANQEFAEKSVIARDCKLEYERSLNQNTPDFAYIHSMLNKLLEAQANALEVTEKAYEKAYGLLTDSQKANLSFFRALRQQEIEKNDELSSQETRQSISTSTAVFTDSPSILKR